MGSLAEPKKAVELELKSFCKRHAIPIHIIPIGSSHKKMFEMYAKSRCSISISITDGVPNSLTESMAMGTFPIQSNTSAANEWVQNGETALLISPISIKEIVSAINRALTDDNLVDKAAVLNLNTIRRKLDANKIKKKAMYLYENIYSSKKRT